MRSITLERDDSVMPFSFLISLVAHSLVLIIAFKTAGPIRELVENITAENDRHATFNTEMQYFANYSPDQLIYSQSRVGATFATSGDVPVDRNQLRPEPSRTLPLRGAPNPALATPVSNRVYFGNQAAAGDATAEAPSASGATANRPSQNRGGLDIPDGPDGIVQAMHEQPNTYRLGGTTVDRAGGLPGTLRSGAANAAASTANPTPGYRVGVIDVPGRPQNLAPTTPQPGQTLDHRPFVPMASTGQATPDNPRELARPPGDGPPEPNGAPSQAGARGYGTRRPIYQPLPTYPEWAERDRVAATPQFDVMVGSDGRISRVRLAVTSGYAELDRQAETAVRRWIYEPRPGQSEERRVVVRFVLRPH